MNRTWTLPTVTEPHLTFLAELLALALRPGDLVTLSGDLGAGKSTFARAIVRAMLDDDEAEVPSPTFSLLQPYVSRRFDVTHVDLYRLSAAHELTELGLDEALLGGVALVEWPERGAGALPEPALVVTLAETSDPDARHLTLVAGPCFAERLTRLEAIAEFLAGDASARPWPRVHYLQGDASPRRYARIVYADRSLVLMDSPRRPDGPAIRNGLPYSRIAHLAEDVRPFVAVATMLNSAGLSAPRIMSADLDQGLLIIEDFGDRVFGAEMLSGTAQDVLWEAATDVLLAARAIPSDRPIPLPGGTPHELPPYDRSALEIETELLLDWLWPLVKGRPAGSEVRDEFQSLWSRVFDDLLAMPSGLVLRDFHSPNLMWMPERGGIARVGVLDFQDAVAGHPAYDLVSLLQDARVDVPAGLEQRLFDRYIAEARASEPDFDAAAFSLAYAALGVQRNTKILGIFARLAMRDAKSRYLGHIPRIWGYLDRGLGHAALAPLAAWYRHHWPAPDRAEPQWPRKSRQEGA